MIKEILKLRNIIFLCLILTILTSSVYADSWYKGLLHVHTRFSTNNGYDGIKSKSGDNCPANLEGTSAAV